MARKIIYIFLGLILAIIAWYFLPFLEGSEKIRKPVKLGLSVTLTGKYPDLGREIRDGALLAMQMINEEGGINGVPLKLIIKDNRFSIERTKQNLEELFKEKVIAVIGPATSTTAKNILPFINERKILVIAPTPTSTELAGLDDYMIRLRPTNKEDAEALAKYVYKNMNLKRIAIIYDIDNPLYTKDFADNFVNHFGKNVDFYLFPFKEGDINIRVLSKKILSYSPDAVLLITDVYNTALIAQNLRILKPDIFLLSSPWAKFQRLIENGGKRIEGLLTVDTFDEEYGGEMYLRFKKRFIERFGYKPEIAAITGFESVMIIKRAIENGATRHNIKDAILSAGRFEGLQGEIIINKFGDRQIKPFVVKIENGTFKRVKE